MDNVLDELYITDKGELQVKRWKYEEVPQEEHPYPDAEGLRAVRGSWRRVDEQLETIPYHGIIRFYTSVENGQDNRQWYEFSAKFTDGKLVGIQRVNKDSPEYW